MWSYLEQLYFLADTVPVAVLIDPLETIDPALLTLLREGTAHVLYTHEIDRGLLGARIDEIYLACNRRMEHMQRAQHESRSLRNELRLRTQILVRERAFNANILSSISSGLCILDTERAVIWINDHARTLLRTGSVEVIGAPLECIVAEAFAPAFSECLTRVLHAGETQALMKVRAAELHVQLSCFHLLDDCGTSVLERILNVNRNELIDRRRQRQEKRRQPVQNTRGGAEKENQGAQNT